ncbi:MAG TPA: 4-(cytidine 5'-diphospho)-2-C-methyl-D-erythritol kinase [Puia sp.]|jgi:4-diphosphocytidyl-2-C-methyl-D-erythritol kinase|nr:4-(cytidine 5'-diphospho)-2-C-methyl-D-erythritol kinase [Puia sp.]
MISFPHAKINLGLSIIAKRPDGFHNLETVFYPIPLRDVLEIIPAQEDSLFQTGLQIPHGKDDNLVTAAYQMLKKKYPHITSLEIHLHKSIPLGAGLGGGSSDAAETLKLISHFFDLRIPGKEIDDYALKLGSDCPFFMQSSPCIARGRGEILEPISLDLSAYSILLVHPEIRIETAWAYSKIKPVLPGNDLKESILQPVQNWLNTIRNDFELPVFEVYPTLRKIKEKLYMSGAIYAAMTGSGSTIFGIFKKSEIPDSFEVENASQTVIL